MRNHSLCIMVFKFGSVNFNKSFMIDLIKADRIRSAHNTQNYFFFFYIYIYSIFDMNKIFYNIYISLIPPLSLGESE